MSKGKKVMGVLLAIIVLAGIVFGIYLYLRKNEGNELTEERSVRLVSETTDELNKTINTMGNGLANNTTAQSVSVIQSLSASGNARSSSINNYNDYVYFIDGLIDANAYLEMANYALSLNDENKIEFNKTYAGARDSYITVYRNESVVFEYGVKEESDDDYTLDNYYVVIDYNKDKDEPSAFTCLYASESNYQNEGTTVYSFDFSLCSIDFELKMFNCYEVYLENLPSATVIKTLRSKLAQGTLKYNDIKNYIDFESEDDFLYIYTGNIANNLDSIKMVSHNTTRSVASLFDRYGSNVKHYDMLASNKSKLDYEHAINYTSVSSDIWDYRAAANSKYYFTYNETDDKFYFISIEDLKQFDATILELAKTKLATMTSANVDGDWYGNVKIENYGSAGVDALLETLKKTVDALYNLYQDHKDDTNYVSVLLGRTHNGGSGLTLPSASARVGSYLTFDESLGYVYVLSCESTSDWTIDGSFRVFLNLPDYELSLLQKEYYEDYFDKLTSVNSCFEVVNYALSQVDSQKISFDKTYLFDFGEEYGGDYFTFYHIDDVVVFELTYCDEDGDCRHDSIYGVVEYDKEKNIPSAFYCFEFREYVTNDDVGGEQYVRGEYKLSSLDFLANKFYYGYIFLNIYNTVSLTSLNMYRNKLANATLVWNDIKDLVTEEPETINETLSFYSGNIANNIHDVSARMVSEHGIEYTLLSYNDNIKHLDVTDLNNSRIDYNNAMQSETINEVYRGMGAVKIGTQSQIYCRYDRSMDKLLFYFVEDFEKFDTEVIGKLKNVFENLEYSDLIQEWNSDVKINVFRFYNETESDEIEKFNTLKRAALYLVEFYQDYRSEPYYVPFLLGYGDYIEHSNYSIEAKMGFDEEKNCYCLRISVDGISTDYGRIYVALS